MFTLSSIATAANVEDLQRFMLQFSSQAYRTFQTDKEPSLQSYLTEVLGMQIRFNCCSNYNTKEQQNNHPGKGRGKSTPAFCSLVLHVNLSYIMSS